MKATPRYGDIAYREDLFEEYSTGTGQDGLMAIVDLERLWKIQAICVTLANSSIVASRRPIISVYSGKASVVTWWCRKSNVTFPANAQAQIMYIQDNPDTGETNVAGTTRYYARLPNLPPVFCNAGMGYIVEYQVENGDVGDVLTLTVHVSLIIGARP